MSWPARVCPARPRWVPWRWKRHYTSGSLFAGEAGPGRPHIRRLRCEQCGHIILFNRDNGFFVGELTADGERVW